MTTEAPPAGIKSRFGGQEVIAKEPAFTRSPHRSFKVSCGVGQAGPGAKMAAGFLLRVICLSSLQLCRPRHVLLYLPRLRP